MKPCVVDAVLETRIPLQRRDHCISSMLVVSCVGAISAMARALGAINNTEPTKANMTTIEITNVNLKCIFFPRSSVAGPRVRLFSRQVRNVYLNY